MIDPTFAETLFYTLKEDGQFQRQGVDEPGFYQSRVLPRFKIKPDLIWQDPLPGMRDVVRLVDGMMSA